MSGEFGMREVRLPFDTADDAEAELFEHLIAEGVPQGLAAQFAAVGKATVERARRDRDTLARLRREAWFWRTLAICSIVGWTVMSITIFVLRAYGL